MNPIKMVLEELYYKAVRENGYSGTKEKTIHIALASIASIIEGEKKSMGLLNPNKDGILISETASWNACCDHIVNLIRGER